MNRSKFALLFVALLWTAVGLSCPLVLLFSPASLRITRMSWLFLLPAGWLAVLLFFAGLFLLLRLHSPVLISDYETVDQLEKLQRLNLAALFLVPFVGAFGSWFMLPASLSQQPNPNNPLFALCCFACFFCLLAVVLWRRQAGFHVLLGLILGGFSWLSARLLAMPWPSTKQALQQAMSICLFGALVLLLTGVILRWIAEQAVFRPFFQRALYVMAVVFSLGSVVTLWTSPSSGRGTLSNLIACGSFLLSLLALGSFALLAILSLWRLGRSPRGFFFPGGPGYIYLGSFPLALLLAFFGVFFLTGPRFPQTQDHMPLFLLMVIHIIAFHASAIFASVHREGFRQHNRVWLFFRPVLFYLLFFLPFGFVGFAFLKNASCF